jgi:hypothetical protein
VTPETFWERIAEATELVAHKGAKRVDGHGFKVYTIPSGVTRIDIEPGQAPKEAVANGHTDVRG